jgi:hypothetical protein
VCNANRNFHTANYFESNGAKKPPQVASTDGDLDVAFDYFIDTQLSGLGAAGQARRLHTLNTRSFSNQVRPGPPSGCQTLAELGLSSALRMR